MKSKYWHTNISVTNIYVWLLHIFMMLYINACIYIPTCVHTWRYIRVVYSELVLFGLIEAKGHVKFMTMRLLASTSISSFSLTILSIFISIHIHCMCIYTIHKYAHIQLSRYMYIHSYRIFSVHAQTRVFNPRIKQKERKI